MMPGVKFADIQDAILDAFNEQELTEALRRRMSVRLDVVAGTGIQFQTIAFRVVDWTDKKGIDADLVDALFKERPTNPKVADVYQKYGLAPRASVQAAGQTVESPATAQTLGYLQKTVRQRIPTLDAGAWQARMSQASGRVCRITIGGHAAGTGFLVGPGAVLTNYHVVEKVRQSGASQDVVCEFDYRTLADGNVRVGMQVALNAAEWLIDFSPFTEGERKSLADESLPKEDELDYALLKLDRAIGNEPIEKKPGGGAPARGWFSIPTAVGATAFAAQGALMILQHPDGLPLTLAVDTSAVLDIAGTGSGLNANGTRVRYATNTKGGASGSPVMDLNWNLLALHHYGDPTYTKQAQYNQGVPITRIQAMIANRKKDDELG